jgi:hypothetical protein
MARKSLHPQRKRRREDGLQVRHTHSVIAGIEDAIAILWEILDEAARSILFMRSKTKRVVKILKIMRAGPHAYPTNNIKRKDIGEDDS